MNSDFFTLKLNFMKFKKTILFLFTLCVISTLVAFNLNAEWKINAKDSVISFTMPNGKHNGTISGLEAVINFDPTNAEFGVITATAIVSTIKTDNEKLDQHLQSADFFDSKNHPTISFKSERILKNDSGYVAIGKLSMRDSVKNINLPFKFVRNEKNTILKGTIDILAGDYGVGKTSSTKADHVIIALEVPIFQD